MNRYRALDSEHCYEHDEGPFVFYEEAKALITGLEAEVADLKLQLGMCDHSLHASWNDAIEAALPYVLDHQAREDIHALKRKEP